MTHHVCAPGVAHNLMLTTAWETPCSIIAIQRIARITYEHRQFNENIATQQPQNARNEDAKGNNIKEINGRAWTDARHKSAISEKN